MAETMFRRVPPEPAHPAIVRLHDDLVAIYEHIRDKYQGEIDKAFDRVSRQIGFVVTTTIPVTFDVGEKGAVKQISVAAENLKGTLFEHELSAALRPLHDDPVPIWIQGSYNLYLIWYEALKLKLLTDWVEPAHLAKGLIESVRSPVAGPAASAYNVIVDHREPAHWFDPGQVIAAEEAVLISAMDEVYPGLRLAERIDYYRRGLGRTVQAT
jgi:hypothetical protein